MRGCTRRSTDGSEDVSRHDGHEQDSADVVQPRRGRHSERTDSARDRRPGRRHGHSDRRHGDTVPYAQQEQGSRHVEPQGTVRPWQVHLEVARGARRHAEPRHLAGPGGRAADRGAGDETRRMHRRRRHPTTQGKRHTHHLGMRNIRTSRGHHRRHLPQRTDAHRQENGAGRQMRRTGIAPPHREHHAARHTLRPHEDGHAGAHRPPLGTLRGHHRAAGRGRQQPLQLHGRKV